MQGLGASAQNRFAEIFVTDRRGHIVAATNITTDFAQGPGDEEPDGELWWAMAVDSGIYVGAVEYDKSADSYGVDLALAIVHGARP